VNYDINPESYDLIHPEMKKYFDAWISKYIFNLDTPVSGFIEKLKSCWMITPTFHTQSPGTGYPADHVKVASRKVEKIGPEMDRNSLIFTKGMDLLQPIFVIKVKVSCTDVASGGTDHWIVFRQENDADGPNPSIWKEGYSKSFRVLLTKEFTPYTQAPPGLDTFASLLKGDEVKRCENYVFTFGVEQAKKELEPIYNEIKKTPLIENIS
jgi:hypothetical protein